jgi:probable O-glycosylation ligase (exosortase A-associated)
VNARPARRGRILPRPVALEPAVASEPDMPLFAGIAWTPAYAAFLAYVFAITTYRLPIGTAAMATALLTLPMEHRPLRVPPVVYLTLGLLGWAAVGWASSNYPDIVWAHIVEFSKVVGVILVAVNVLTTWARLRLFLVMFLGAFAFYPVRGSLITYFAYGGGVDGRAVWTFSYSNPNDLAGMCLLLFSLAAGVLVTERKRWIRACALAGVVILPVDILLTGSRGAFLALAACAAVALKAHWRNAKMLGLAAAVVVIAAVAAPDSVWERLSTLKQVVSPDVGVEVNDEGSARQRLEIWKVARTIALENPVTGVGLGAYNSAHYVYAQRPVFDPTALGPRDAHDTYLRILAETGIPGLLLFLGIIGSIVLDAERTRRRLRATRPARALQLYYMELGLLGYLVAGIWGSYGELVLTYLHLSVIFAATQILKEGDAPARVRGPRAPARFRSTVARSVVRGVTY